MSKVSKQHQGSLITGERQFWWEMRRAGITAIVGLERMSEMATADEWAFYQGVQGGLTTIVTAIEDRYGFPRRS